MTVCESESGVLVPGRSTIGKLSFKPSVWPLNTRQRRVPTARATGSQCASASLERRHFLWRLPTFRATLSLSFSLSLSLFLRARAAEFPEYALITGSRTVLYAVHFISQGTGLKSCCREEYLPANEMITLTPLPTQWAR